MKSPLRIALTLFTLTLFTLLSFSVQAAQLWTFTEKETQEFFTPLLQAPLNQRVAFRDEGAGDILVIKSLKVNFKIEATAATQDKINAWARDLAGLAEIATLNPEFKVNMKKGDNDSVTSTFELELSVETTKSLLGTEAPNFANLGIKKLSIAGDIEKAENLSQNLAGMLLELLKPTTIDAFVERAKNDGNLEIKDLYEKVGNSLQAALPRTALENHYNFGKVYTEDQWSAIKHAIASGLLAYGFQREDFKPLALSESVDLLYRVLKIIQFPTIQVQDFKLLRLSKNGKCEENEMLIKFQGSKFISPPPSNDFCASLTTGPSTYEFPTAVSSLFFLEIQSFIKDFKTVDGKKVRYVRDPQSTPFEPVYNLVAY